MRGVCFVTCGKVPSIWRTARQFAAILEPEDFKRVVERERTLWTRNGGGSREEGTMTGGVVVANVIALPRSFPRVRGNQENNEWLGCSSTALSLRERKRARANNRKREKQQKWRNEKPEFWPRCSRWPGFHTGER